MQTVRETLTLSSMAPDIMPADASGEVWTTGINAIFRNGETVRAMSDAKEFGASTISPSTIVYVEPFDTVYWVYANESGIWCHDGSVETNITPATGWTGFTSDTIWTSCVINGLAVINASSADPVYWDGNPANVCKPLPGWPEAGRCIAMRAHKNFLFAVGMVSEGGQRVRWSDAAEAGVIPGSWTPTAENLAGFVDLAPMSSSALDAMSLRDSFLVYKRESVWIFDFVGGNAVFNARKLFAERGIAASNGVCRGPDDQHLFVGSDGDIHLTDGVQARSVLDGRAQRYFYDDFREPAGGVYSAAALGREKLGVICYPSGGANYGTRALVYDFAGDAIGFRDMPEVRCMGEGRALSDPGNVNTWDGDSGVWDQDNSSWNTEINSATVQDVVLGTTSDVRRLGAGDDALDLLLEKQGLAFGNPQRRKTVSRLWPKVDGVEGETVTFRIGGQDAANGPTELSDPVTWEIGKGYPVDVFVQGRFVTVLVESKGGSFWLMGSMDIEYREAGQW